MSFEPLIQAIKNVSKKVMPSTYFRVVSRERVLNYVATQEPRRWYQVWMPKSVASILLAAILVVFVLQISPTTTFASYVGEAQVLSGRLNLQRDGSQTNVLSAVKLQVGDIISLPDQATVQIHFIDESQTLLSDQAVVGIDSFLINTHNIRNSLVALSLQQGQMLTNVDKEDGDVAKLQIETPTSLIEAQNSNFKVTVNQEGGTEVTALKNSVTVQALDHGNSPSNKRVLAQAQAIEGYKVKINKNNLSQPLQLIADKSGTASSNENSSGSSVPNANLNAPTPVLAAAAQEQALSNTDIAQVKLYQSIDALNSGDLDRTNTIFQGYQTNLAQVYQALTGQTIAVPEGNDVPTLIANSILDQVLLTAGNLPENDFSKGLHGKLLVLQTVEKAAKEKAVFASVSIMTNPEPVYESNSNSSGDDTSGGDVNANLNVNKDVTDQLAVKALEKINSKVAFQVNSIKSLIPLKDTLSPDKQKDIQVLIDENLASMVSYINSVGDWKTQQQVTRGAMALFPNDKMYKDFLVVLRAKLSDRVSFLVTEKIWKLK